MTDSCAYDSLSNFVAILRERSLRQPDTVAYIFAADDGHEQQSRTYYQLDSEARAIAARLQQQGLAGNRAVLLYPPGLDFVSSLLGCLYAGVIAVPCYFSRTRRTAVRLHKVVESARPAVILTVRDCLDTLQSQFAEDTSLERVPTFATDSVPAQAAMEWQWHEPELNNLAYLQFTSGSTAQPRGVKVSHANLLANSRSISEAFGHHAHSKGVIWLPPHHDMGLIGGIFQPLLCGRPVLLMSPVHVVQQPLRWLRAISEFRGTVSGGPNFIYDRCVETIGPADRESLDLSCWEVAFNGSEPVRAGTLRRFAEAFASCGFRREALFPCYGLAESTLIVSGGPKLAGPHVREFDKRSLSLHRTAYLPDPSSPTVELVASGRPVSDATVRIVDPASRRPCQSGQLGEIWVSGPSVANGYWNQADDGTWTATLADTPQDSHTFMRTGDLGFLSDDQLFVTGRIKDLIIVDGRNHYPQDIEQTVEHCHPALRGQRAAIFAIDSGGCEQLIVVSEVHRNGRNVDAAAVIQAVRESISEKHELMTSAVVLVRIGQVPVTSSGKVQRFACRELFQCDALSAIEVWRGPEFGAAAERVATSEAETWPIVAGDSLGSVMIDSETVAAETVARGVARGNGHPPNGHRKNGHGKNGHEKNTNGKNGHETKHPDATRSSEEIREWLVGRLQQHRGGGGDTTIDVRRPLDSYGLTSRDAVEISGELEVWLKRRLSPALIYEFPTVELLSLELSGEQSAAEEAAASLADSTSSQSLAINEPLAKAPITNEPIAIVGIGCRLPGAAGPDAFWRLLAMGTDAIGNVPEDRWGKSFVPPTCLVPGHDPHGESMTWGGFLDQIALFDAEFFGIARREATCIDPQQRMLLEVSFEALEDAGQVLESVRGSQTGVFVGISTHDYGELCMSNADSIEPYWSTGNATSIAANRLSYCLDLKGPSLAIDTACSSSLVAVHLACQSLRAGECDLALAAGVNAILTPTISANFSQAGGLAPDGRCKAFDARANGMVRSEGAGVVVLKRLSDALQSGDQIYAVVRGSAINQDGRSNGITAPLQSAQEAVLREAYRRAAVSPGKVQYIETHGAGTMLGDVIEARALSAVLSLDRTSGERCVLGSVKTNIGHCEAAAGIAGLIKVALAMKHRQIPPNLHFVSPNPNIPFDEMPCFVSNQLASWPESDGRRLAGVSSFGFGGTNAHLVLESAPLQATYPAPANYPVTAPCEEKVGHDPIPAHDSAPPSATAYLLPVSAADPSALQTLAARLIKRLDNGDSPRFAMDDLCHAASVRRTHHRHRAAISFQTPDELHEELEKLSRGEFSSAVTTGVVPADGSSKLAFVFSGHGGQWWGMAQPLLERSPVFRRRIEQCDRVLQPLTDWSLIGELSADQSHSRLSGMDIQNLEISQTALVAFQIALADIWQSWGIRPAAVVGHSVGEVAAACVAGALTLPDAMRIVVTRSRLLAAAAQHAPQDSGMAAMRISAAEAEKLLGEYRDRVWISVYNSPKYTVLSGEMPVLEELIRSLKKQKVGGRLMKVPGAGHTPLLEPTRIQLESMLSDVRPQPSSIAFYSTVTGGPVEGTQLGASYWGQNIRQTVSFAPAIDKLVDNHFQSFVELGPMPLLAAAITQTLDHRDQKALVVPSLRHDEDHFVGLYKAAGALYCAGYEIAWRTIYPSQKHWVDLPTYPWRHERFWISPAKQKGKQTKRAAANYDAANYDAANYDAANYDAANYDATDGTNEVQVDGHPFLARGLELASEVDTHCWQFALGCRGLPLLRDHRIEDRPVVPAAMLIELALAAAREIYGTGMRWQLLGLALPASLPIAEDNSRTMQVMLTREGADQGRLRCYSRCNDANYTGTWQLAAECQLRRLGEIPENRQADIATLDAARQKCTHIVGVEEHYASLDRRGYLLGPSYRTLREIWRGDGEALGNAESLGKAQALGRIALPADSAHRVDGFVIHPVLVDACLQIVNAVLPNDNRVYLPTRMDSIRCWSNPLPDAVLWSHVVLRPTATGTTVIAEAVTAEAVTAEAVTAEAVTADIVVWDDSGGRVLEIAGLSLDVFAGAKPDQTSSEAKLDDWLYEVQWQAEPLPPQSQRDDPMPRGTWIILNDAQGVGGSLVKSLEHLGQECLVVVPGTEFRCAQLNHYELDPNNVDHYRRLLQEIHSLGLPPLRGIVQLWGLRAAVPETTVGSLESAENLLLLGTMMLVQALDQTEFATPPRLWLVTQFAQVIDRDQATVSLEQAPLWGMGRTLQREHPAWRCTLVDLDGQTEAQSLCDELVADCAEDQLAFRRNLRHIARLARPSCKSELLCPSRPAELVENFKFAALQHRSNGDSTATRFCLRETERQLPGQGEVELEVEFAGDVVGWESCGRSPERATRTELESGENVARSGDRPQPSSDRPQPSSSHPFGIGCVARVASVGEGVEQPCVGDRVLALAPGCFASRITVPAELVVPCPQQLRPEQIASMAFPLFTAWHGLVRLGNLSNRDRVLIHGAASAVGLVAMQIARRIGKSVLATATRSQYPGGFGDVGWTNCGRSPDRATQPVSDRPQPVSEQDGVYWLDADSPVLGEQILAATQGEGIDIVLDCGELDVAAVPLSSLRPLARYLEVVPAKRQPKAQRRMSTGAENQSYSSVYPQSLLMQRPDYCGDLLREIAALLDSGEFSIRALPCESVALDRAVDILSEGILSEVRLARSGDRPELDVWSEAKSSKTAASNNAVPTVIDMRDRGSARVVLADAEPRLASDATYLIAGGMGGLGLCLAHWLVDRGARNIVLLGRRTPSAEIQSQLDELRAMGATVLAVQADLANRDDVRGALERIRSELLPLLPLRGVFHCAAVMNDVVLALMKPEQWRAATASKVLGAWNLHELTLGDKLDYFVLYSSGASLIGPPGSANYAAGNAFLDALAEYRRRHGLAALAVNWGLWEGVGMVAHSDQLQQQRIKLTGFQTIPPDVGVSALGRLMQSNVTRMAVMPVDWARLRRAARATTHTTFLEDLFLEVRGDVEDSDRIVEELGDLLAATSGSDREGRLELLRNYLRNRLANTLSTAAEKIPLDRPLTELGIDSLMALELKNRLETELKTSIRIVEFLKGPTLSGFASMLLEQIDSDSSAQRDEQGSPASSARKQATTNVGVGKSAQQVLNKIDDLSQEEVEALYEQMLAEEECQR